MNFEVEALMSTDEVERCLASSPKERGSYIFYMCWVLGLETCS